MKSSVLALTVMAGRIYSMLGQSGCSCEIWKGSDRMVAGRIIVWSHLQPSEATPEVRHYFSQQYVLRTSQLQVPLNVVNPRILQ